MPLAVKNTVRIGSLELKDFLSYRVIQAVHSEHRIEIICRREIFESEENPAFTKTPDIIGEDLNISIESLDGKSRTNISGIITEIETTKENQAGGDIVFIRAFGSDIVLNDGINSRSFENKTLEKIVKDTLKDYKTNLKQNIYPEKSKDPLPYIVQYKESSFSFLRRLASRYGEWFFYDGDKNIYFGKLPDKKVNIEYGKDLFRIDFAISMDDLNFRYQAYNFLNAEYINSSSGAQNISPVSRAAQKSVQKSGTVFPHETQNLYNFPFAESREQKQLDADVKMEKGARIGSFIRCEGTSDNLSLSLGCIVKIKENIKEKGQSKSVDHGSYLVTAITHTCDRTGNYQNIFTAVASDLAFPPYSNPHGIPVCEIQSAIVKDNTDPKGLGRIRVQFAWQQEENTQSPWIRMANLHGGDDKGVYFIPEKDEEVIVGFEGGNAEKPYIIGSMYHGKAKPDSWKNDDNDFKAIRTRSGHTIEFNDKDGNEEIKIYDHQKNNYTITLATHSSKITIEAKEDIEIKANNIEIKANKDLKIQASDIENKASGKMTINAGSQLEQKAGIIKIN